MAWMTEGEDGDVGKAEIEAASKAPPGKNAEMDTLEATRNS